MYLRIRYTGLPNRASNNNVDPLPSRGFAHRASLCIQGVAAFQVGDVENWTEGILESGGGGESVAATSQEPGCSARVAARRLGS